MTSVLFSLLFIAACVGSLFYLPMGILTWVWISLQSPQQLIGAKIPTSLIIAICCVIALAFNRRYAQNPLNKLTYIILIFLGHTAITTVFSVLPDQSFNLFDRLWKTIVLVFFIIMFMNTRTRIHAVVCIIVLSIGLLAVKAAIFTGVTGGGARIFGPRNSQIADNNHFGAAMVMTLPFAVYLVQQTADPMARMALRMGAAALPVAALFTYSRGALLALSSVSAVYWWNSKYKVRIAIAFVCVGLAGLPFMPERWIDRMSTIQNTTGGPEAVDGSVQGRFDSWAAHWEMANRRPLIGGGFRTIEVLSVWATLSSAPTARAAHNSFFQVVGEHGFPGLFLFVLLLANGFLTAMRIRRRTKFMPQLSWAHGLATACLLSLTGYGVSSLALSLAYYDLFYVILALLACLKALVDKSLAGTGNG